MFFSFFLLKTIYQSLNIYTCNILATIKLNPTTTVYKCKIYRATTTGLYRAACIGTIWESLRFIHIIIFLRRDSTYCFLITWYGGRTGTIHGSRREIDEIRFDVFFVTRSADRYYNLLRSYVTLRVAAELL